MKCYKTAILVIPFCFCGCLPVQDLGTPDDQALQECGKNLQSLGLALDMYSTDWNGNYPQESVGFDVLTPNYLKSIPVCPVAEKPNYRYRVGVEAPANSEKNPNYYYLNCIGDHHSAVTASDFPVYTERLGFVRKPSELEVKESPVLSPSPSGSSSPSPQSTPE